MEGYILKNYYKLQSPSFFKFQYVFLDSEDYLADQLFIKYKVTVDFGDEYVKENSPYHVIFCKIRKRDEKSFSMHFLRCMTRCFLWDIKIIRKFVIIL